MPAVLPVTIAKEETQARLPSTKKQIYVLTAIYHNRAVVSTGGPALFGSRNHAPNWLTPLTTRCHVLYVLYIHISTHTGYRVCFRFHYHEARERSVPFFPWFSKEKKASS